MTPGLPVLLELQQANLITSEERERLKNLSGLVRAQCGKPFEELAITVDLLRRYGCNEEFDFLAGEQTYVHPNPLFACVSAEY